MTQETAPSSPASVALDLRGAGKIGLAALVFAAAFAALMLAVRSAGDKQVTFASHEVVFVEPGGRVVYYPARKEAVVKGWLLPTLASGRVYQLWAVEGGQPRPLATTTPSTIREISVFLRTDLTRTERVIVTNEPAPGSSAPTTPPVMEMVPGR